jgi:nucleotide-binding universal stress UspA family protein
MNDTNGTLRVYSILVGVDYSEASALALTEAVLLARSHERSHIHLVHSIPGMPPIGRASGTPDLTTAGPVLPAHVDQLSADMSGDMQVFVEKVLTKLDPQKSEDQARATPHWTIHIRLSDPTPAIVQLASDIEADLIVVGTHGRSGLARLLLGSVAEGVVRRAPCPVLVVRPVGVELAADGPRIEPPCPQCLEARRASAGAQFWCERHQEHHARAHTYHFTPFRDSHQSGTLLHPLQ